MFSNSSKYAIKAVLFLAVNSNEDHRVMVKDMAEPINVPQAYLAKLLQELSRKDIISSKKGPKGGFYLSDKNSKLTLMDVISVIDGSDKFDSCLLSLEKCNSKKPCPLHNLAGPSRAILIKSLSENTLKDFSKQIKKEEAFLPL
ncbi:RrF2 family transcriptional regulator [Pontimicrobium aquaticum]|uniref:Rrf2 family transcriptional regulator n=1 Tax=Pontimicrobium aquaticum TaxID=2565367 RepID=A0A4U0ESB8_9FLAO|nr:Rrf2 family transcriptional regulator [Pontimicrobium aquaticum]TJY34611.1 Rrf2 family transcriptional regulator [Pontimicrobium aquaticum]